MIFQRYGPVVLYLTLLFISQDALRCPWLVPRTKLSRLCASSDSIPPKIITTEALQVNTIQDTLARPIVCWKAAASASVRVKESKRSAEDYMALPASQYSVLTADQVQRLNDTDFKVTLGTINFFGTRLTPVLYVTVTVLPEQARSEICVHRAEIGGNSELARSLNGFFNISAVNVVRALREDGVARLCSDTQLQVSTPLPPTPLPLALVQRGGGLVLQGTLNVIVPTFVRILAADFRRWSAGSDDRGAVEGARLDQPQ